ncbi:MAG: hypothetical protein K2Q07_01390 [Burkholderiaceae bacterium]|nr:hypothetical protein [Burkholderiaceae bacterium]MBY0467611.1 hypothetical protein [Burkholderiaceae bacterium]
MPTSIKYIGTLDPYFEIGVTGKQGVWHRGQSGDVPDGDATLLIASGLFIRTEVPLTAAAVAAAQAGLSIGALQGSRFAAVGGVLSLFGHQINTAGAAASFVLQSPALAPFFGSRTIHANYGTSPQTITIAKSAVTPTAGNNGLALTWNSRTWAGATTVVQPAGSGTGADVVPSITISDWLWVPGIARTDFPTRNQLILERAYYAASGSVQRACFANAMGDLFAATGLEFATNVAASADAVTTITSFAPAATNTWMCPIGVEFAYGVPTAVVADVGDSLMRGQESTTASNGWLSVSQRACLLKTGAAIWQPMTFAVTGQTHAASYQTGLEVVSKLLPTFLCFRAWSPNDGAPTQALIDAAWGRTLSLIEHCRRNKVAPVVCTTPPRNSLSAGEDAFLKIQNARVKSLAGYVLVSDEAAVVEDPSDRAKLLPAFNSGDGLHIVSAGYAAMAAVRSSVLTA